MTSGVAISLFAGAGGLDLGAVQAGFEVRAANEIDHDAADTFEKNLGAHLGTGVDRRNLAEVSTRELLRAAGLRGNQRPELLIGGPPCTPFSKAGFWLEWKREGRDPDAQLLSEYTRVLAEARPRAFLLENVNALTFNNRQSKSHFARLLSDIEDAGYKFRWKVVCAADYGVAQARKRLFVVGVRAGEMLPDFPEPSHSSSPAEGELAHVTSGDVLDGLTCTPEAEEKLSGKYADLVPSIPPGDNYLFFTSKRGHPDPKFEWRSRYWSFLLKLDPKKPAPTIQASPGPSVGPFHWENRRLRVGELKRLFSFPDDYEFVGGRRSIGAQIGNSVPPSVAKVILETLAV